VVEDELYDIERQTRERERQAGLASAAAHAVPETQPAGAVASEAPRNFPAAEPTAFPAAALDSEPGPETASGATVTPEPVNAGAQAVNAAALPGTEPTAEGHADRS
jgi:hypothetical protein